MGRRQFWAWVDQVYEEAIASQETSPHSWRNAEKDDWWQQARERRKQQMGR